MSGADRSYQLVRASSTPVTFDGHDVTVLEHSGELWFVANEICDVLEIKQPHRAVAGLDDDEKGRHSMTTPGGPQQVTVISESGMYTLILRSRKPQARPFRRWVTHELLPAIRRTGRYESPALPAPQEPVKKPFRLPPKAHQELAAYLTELAEDRIAKALDNGTPLYIIERLVEHRNKLAAGHLPGDVAPGAERAVAAADALFNAAVAAELPSSYIVRVSHWRAQVVMGKKVQPPRLTKALSEKLSEAMQLALPAPRRQRVATVRDLQPGLGEIIRCADGTEVHGWIQGRMNPAWFPEKRELLRERGTVVPDEVYSQALPRTTAPLMMH